MREHTLAEFGVECHNIDATLDKQLAAALQHAVDPELGVDMLNLGLVYRLEQKDDGSYRVEMLLTMIGCPLTDYLSMLIEHAMALAVGDAPITVQYRMDVQWSMARMSRAARMTLHV